MAAPAAWEEDGTALIYEDVAEEVSFGGGHVMHAGDVIKWVPLAQGSCTGYDDDEHGGVLGPGVDGWGDLVATVTLAAHDAPYALCTMETTRQQQSFAFHSHVLLNVAAAPSPPPQPPAAPPPFHLLQLLPALPPADQWTAALRAPLAALGSLAIGVAAVAALYILCACACVCKHMSPFRFHKLQEEPSPLEAPYSA